MTGRYRAKGLAMSSEEARVGQLFAGRFRIERLIGRGGMASVYRANDTQLQRDVALKVFEAGEAGDDSRREAEVHALARLNHPNLVSLFDAHLAAAGDADPSFLVMELVDGPSLHDAIAAGSVDGPQTALIAAEVSEALHTAHTLGIVHRDLKPGNILLAPTEVPSEPFRAKLADFGIAHLVGSTRLTVAGTVMGTAAYLSPEQITGTDPGTESDLYSLGLVLLECLTGSVPFPGTMAESMSARLVRDPEIPSDLPPGWQALLAQLSSRDPALRPTALDVSIRSRSLAHELDGWTSSAHRASEQAVDAATAAMPAPTLLLPSPDQPTAVLARASTTSATRVLATAEPIETKRSVRPIVVGAVVALLLAGGIALSVALGGNGTGAATTPTGGVSVAPSSAPSPTVSVANVPVAPSAPVAPGKGNGKGNGNGHNKP
jgi:serine/threonine protein kinase